MGSCIYVTQTSGAPILVEPFADELAYLLDVSDTIIMTLGQPLHTRNHRYETCLGGRTTTDLAL